MGKKILVVDDEPDILKVIVFRLKRLGYEMICGTNGAEALSLMRDKDPDLLVIDFRMPDIDGLEVSRRLRSEERFKKTPIILISASSTADISDAIRNAQVNEYIKKPFDPEHLLDIVRKYI